MAKKQNNNYSSYLRKADAYLNYDSNKKNGKCHNKIIDFRH
jgi:hypothetical protein